MTLLDKKDLLCMIENNDETKLVLRFSGSDEIQRDITASGVVDEIKYIADEESFLLNEDEIWNLAYVCTVTDFENEQKEGLE